MLHGFTTILWDFNGTLLDDVATGMESVNPMLAARGLPVIPSREAYHTLFRFPIIDYYRLLGFDVEDGKYDVLASEWVERYNENVKHASLYPGAAKLLGRIRSTGTPQVILSATERNMLEGQLASLGIRGYFDEVIGMDDIYAYSKTERGVRWMEARRPGRAVLIGDTPHDRDTARAMGIAFLPVAQGHAPASAFGGVNSVRADAESLPVFADLPSLEAWLFS